MLFLFLPHPNALDSKQNCQWNKFYLIVAFFPLHLHFGVYVCVCVLVAFALAFKMMSQLILMQMLWLVMEQHTYKLRSATKILKDRVGVVGWEKSFQVKITIVAITYNGFYACGRGNKMGMVDSRMGHTHTYVHLYTKCIWHALNATRKWACMVCVCAHSHSRFYMSQSKCCWEIVGN